MSSEMPPREEVIVAELLARRAAESPDRAFVAFGDEEWSNAKTAELAWATAQGFTDFGVRRGDTVSAWLPTGKHALLTWFGLNAVGASFAPLNLSYRGRLLENALNTAQSKLLVAHADLIERLHELDLRHLEKVVIVGEGGSPPHRFACVRWGELLRSGAKRPELHPPVQPWDDMCLINTSGTTGPSKAVRCSYLHHYTSEQSIVLPEIGADDRYFVFLPIFHVSGTYPIYSALRRNASILMRPEFDTRTFWDDVRKYNVTFAFGIGAIITFLNKQPPSPHDADNPLRIMMVGPMNESAERFSRRFGVKLYQIYAMTEIPAVTRTELNPKNWRSCGKLLDPDNYEIRIVDENDQELPMGVAGEAMVRHNRPWSLNSGYKGMPEATADSWRNGWFHTGDVLYRDAEGFYYYVDRTKDALRRRGENVSSAEVEGEIMAHPAVQQAAVIAVASEMQEDDIKAVVVLKKGVPLDHKELIEYLIPRLPYFMVPRYIEFVDDLPMTPTLKIYKVELRRQGITPNTWDREATGIAIKRERLSAAKL